ncbi:MAG TPA: DUF4386 domain-containing protein [Anaerolineales bacterium]|nr:DUF4386 domain-containing protein [Anaerolineales bacterium]HND49384.1 DUF4386 domain-containing protein [Anaerolineales bacterium]
MTSTTPYRKTEIYVALLWIITAAGAIGGASLINPIINASDYLTQVFPKSVTLTSGMFGWMINDIGIVFIGLLMYPILKKHSESMALGYLSMRMFESLLMIVGVFFALMLIPLSRDFINAGTADVSTLQTIGSILKQAENWFLNLLQLIFLGIGGLILNVIFYKTKLVPRAISIFGFIGYALLLPAAVVGLFGLLDPTPGGPGSILAVPVALWEIIIMPVWLFTKGFNTDYLSTK